MKKINAQLETLLQVPAEHANFQNTLKAFDEILAHFMEELDAIDFLQHVSPTEKVRSSAETCSTKYNQFLDADLFTREPLFQRFQLAAGHSPQLDEKQELVLHKIMVKFEDNGLKLSAEKRQELIELRKKLVELQLQFDTNITKAKATLNFSKDELAGMSDNFIAGLQKNPDDTYTITTAYPHYLPFIENATNAEARKKLQFLFWNRASDKNVALLEQILPLRQQIAELLGFKNHAEFVLRNRMSKSPKTVDHFLSALQKKLRQHAERNVNLLFELKKQAEPNAPEVYDWDRSYYMNLAKKQRYNVDNEALRAYFPFPHVKQKLFETYQQLLGLQFESIQAATWHPAVEVYRVTDSTSHQTVGYFYLDLFPRDGKYTHAAAWGLVEGHQNIDGTYQQPVSALVTNFNPPRGRTPSLLSHSEVQTLFHEFGHVMHNTLAHQPYRLLSGYQVYRDFVEAPSKMMENWIWEPKVLKEISSHYQTKAPLDDVMIQNIIAAKNQFSGIYYTRQALLSRIDHVYHTQKNVDTTATLAHYWKKITLSQMHPGTHFQAGFGHLVGYDAQYYTYLWSEVFAADMFSRFAQEGTLNPETGMSYRENILAPGASVEPRDMVEKFLGRKSTQEAFLRSIGL